MKKEKVLIACSGGPDSMALLDMYKDKKDVLVCHINYHKRPTANRDENYKKAEKNLKLWQKLEFKAQTDYYNSLIE